MDILTPPTVIFFFPSCFSLFWPPPCCLSIPALQVQISCCLLDVNRARHKSFHWLNIHLSTKGKNAFLLMINDSTGNKASTYTGFIYGEDCFLHYSICCWHCRSPSWLWRKGLRVHAVTANMLVTERITPIKRDLKRNVAHPTFIRLKHKHDAHRFLRRALHSCHLQLSLGPLWWWWTHSPRWSEPPGGACALGTLHCAWQGDSSWS